MPLCAQESGGRSAGPIRAGGTPGSSAGDGRFLTPAVEDGRKVLNDPGELPGRDLGHEDLARVVRTDARAGDAVTGTAA